MRDPGRRLRIGYVSSDFRESAVSLFMLPVIESHDRSAFEIHCYYNNLVADAVTERIRRHADHWHELAGLSDEQAAADIRAHGIDILVDLAGHLRHNRLLVFARKPAPVQMSYVGYLSTTGLASIDYRITDAVCDPPGLTEQHYSERLLRLPGCMWCYGPHPDMPPAGPLPSLSTGSVTLGSTNNPAKITDRMLRCWAAVLNRVPRSQLLIATTPEPGRERMRKVLVDAGVQGSRIEFADRMTSDRFWDLHRRIDILLDTYPCNGGTTTCDALWLGVPVVTLCGERMHSRAGASLLSAAGLHQLIARSEDQYVEIAARLAGDLQGLALLRSGMRQRMANGGLIDAPAFTRRLEDLYRFAWHEWCVS